MALQKSRSPLTVAYQPHSLCHQNAQRQRGEIWRSKVLFALLVFKIFLLPQPLRIEKTYFAPLSWGQLSPSPPRCALNLPRSVQSPAGPPALPCWCLISHLPVLDSTHCAPWPRARNCVWPVIPGCSFAAVPYTRYCVLCTFSPPRGCFHLDKCAWGFVQNSLSNWKF